MSKSQDAKKTEKKVAVKSPKEKKEAKKVEEGGVQAAVTEVEFECEQGSALQTPARLIDIGLPASHAFVGSRPALKRAVCMVPDHYIARL